MNRYVFASHDPEHFATTSALVEKHQPGDGIRAAIPLQDEAGEHTHLYAVQGIDGDGLDGHEAALRSSGPSTTRFDMCTSPPCLEMVNQFLTVAPMSLPQVRTYAFLKVHLEADAVEGFRLPEVRSRTAGFPSDGGQRLLVQLGAEEDADIEVDLDTWRNTPGVISVRAYRAASADMVRSPHT